jgi:hypothetical protein
MYWPEDGPSERAATCGRLGRSQQAGGWPSASRSSPQLVVAVVWLRDWALTGTTAVLPHMIGNASAITYGLALIGFVIGAVAWLAGRRRVAQIAGAIAIVSWVLTVGVFHALSNPMWIDWFDIVVWTYLATIATIGMFQPPPTHRRLAGATALVALLATQALTTGATPITSVADLVVTQQPIPIGLLDLGADTLHTALRTSWTLLAIAGLAMVGIDPRPAVAACWLFPFLALNHLYWGGPLGLTTGVIAGLAVIAIALATTRAPDTGSGHDLLT